MTAQQGLVCDSSDSKLEVSSPQGRVVPDLTVVAFRIWAIVGPGESQAVGLAGHCISGWERKQSVEMHPSYQAEQTMVPLSHLLRS
jgi:hypothetical protein